MLGVALERRDPAQLALVELRRGEQLAQRQDAGQRRSDVVREGGERGFDATGWRGLRGPRGGPDARRTHLPARRPRSGPRSHTLAHAVVPTVLTMTRSRSWNHKRKQVMNRAPRMRHSAK